MRQATVKKLLATDGTEWEEGKVVGGVEATPG